MQTALMEILHQPCRAPLNRFVRSFAQRRASLDKAVLTGRLPARPDQFIEFYLAERYRMSRDGESASQVPQAVIVGPQSRPDIRLYLSGEIDVFTIRFQPTGFHRLFGVPMPMLVDQGVSIADVLGRSAVKLDEAVRGAADFGARVAVAERWLLDASARAGAATMLDGAARLMVSVQGPMRIDSLAARAGLSPRQFHRRFTAEVGVSPKFYARTLRLERAFSARALYPARSWTDIAHAAGYADQAHFIRDCRALAGTTPTGIIMQPAGMSETSNPAPPQMPYRRAAMGE